VNDLRFVYHHEYEEQAMALRVGEMAPDFALPAVEGERQLLADCRRQRMAAFLLRKPAVSFRAC